MNSDGPISIGVAPASDDPCEEYRLASRDLAEARRQREARPGYHAAVKVQQMSNRLATAERRLAELGRPALRLVA